MSSAFLTGSRAYGIEGSDKSDVDMVIHTTDFELIKALSLIADSETENSVTIGRLHIIICKQEWEHATWQLGTTILHRERYHQNKIPSKKRRIKVIKELFKKTEMKPTFVGSSHHY